LFKVFFDKFPEFFNSYFFSFVSQFHGNHIFLLEKHAFDNKLGLIFVASNIGKSPQKHFPLILYFRDVFFEMRQDFGRNFAQFAHSLAEL